MLKVHLKPEPIVLFCTINLGGWFLTRLNSATTGDKSGHKKFSKEEEDKLKAEFLKILNNADKNDFNFRQLTNPDDWNKVSRGQRRTANSAFFTLLTEYNRRAKAAGKPTITTDDIIRFIKKAANGQNSLFTIEELTVDKDTKFPTGNDFQPCAIIKAPLGLLLEGKDRDILDVTTTDRLMADSNDATTMYMKILFRPTFSRDADEELTVVEEGIQPLSFHRDADSKNTHPQGDIKDKAWDDDYKELPKKMINKGARRYFNQQAEEEATKETS